MGFYPKKQKSSVDLQGTTLIGGVALTTSAAELNLNDGQTATAAEVNIAADKAGLTLAADGAITITNGLVWLEKAAPAVVAATLADPAASDDFKVLTIVGGTAHAHTVTCASGFSGAGAGKDVATFGGAVGDSMTVMAHNSLWHVVALNGVTIA
jgi:hypothetical protein